MTRGPVNENGLRDSAIASSQREDGIESKQSPNQSVIDELENSKNEVLKRVAEKLKTQLESDSVCSGHSSHTSGPGGRTHNSTTTH